MLGVAGLALIAVAVLTGRAKAAPQPQQPVQGQPPQQPGQS
ncbi:hypothetical protein ABJI51_35100 [Amycolatopsis sp. NEAU-NG30]|uniref:Uncharacterized protein n=1 Tax=Amycolatopsis melonis TaxID=3156488 RepID=A0ABV0LPX6_9PSEU